MIEKTLVDLILIQSSEGYMVINDGEYLHDKEGDNVFDQLDEAIDLVIVYLQSLKRGY